MKKITSKNIPLEVKEGVFKSAKEIERMTDIVVQFHADCAESLLRYKDREVDRKHYALAMHHIAALVDLQLNCLGFKLADFNTKDLDKLPPRLREVTLKAQEWRLLPTLEPMQGVTKGLLWEYCVLMQETYNEEVYPLLQDKINELERENESCADENLERSMKEILGRKLA